MLSHEGSTAKQTNGKPLATRARVPTVLFNREDLEERIFVLSITIDGSPLHLLGLVARRWPRPPPETMRLVRLVQPHEQTLPIRSYLFQTILTVTNWSHHLVRFSRDKLLLTTGAILSTAWKCRRWEEVVSPNAIVKSPFMPGQVLTSFRSGMVFCGRGKRMPRFI